MTPMSIRLSLAGKLLVYVQCCKAMRVETGLKDEYVVEYEGFQDIRYQVML